MSLACFVFRFKHFVHDTYGEYANKNLKMKTFFFKRKVSCDIWFPPDKLILGYAQHQEMDVLPVFKKWMFYPSSIILGDADVHDQPTGSVSAHGPASAIQEHQRVFNYMQLRSGGFNPRRNSPVAKKAKASFRVAL